MRKSGISDTVLWAAVLEMQDGLVDADLGAHVVKKRVALPGQGKRGGARVLVATKLADRWYFLFGFNKNERSNIDKRELRVLQETASELLAFDDQKVAIALKFGEIVEVHDGSEKA
ncbi:MAG: type II toxin-antitoxin system RelE/ParE family toxin [Salinisphaera sp.]|nr:type II toxin-antitoxin system RelE/ParE family toxin [Salinisphaera sp.]